MIYIGYQITPVPGKLNELLERIAGARKIAESHGAKQIGGFQISIGPSTGSLFYIVGYKDAETYRAVGKAINDSADMKQALALTASSSSAALQPLPGSPIQ